MKPSFNSVFRKQNISYYLFVLPVFFVVQYNYFDRHSTAGFSWLNSRLCETAKPWFKNSTPRPKKFRASEAQNHPKTRFRGPSQTHLRFRDRDTIFRDPRFSRNDSISPLLSQLLRLPFECKRSKTELINSSHVKTVTAFIQGFLVNSYFKRLLKETENMILKLGDQNCFYTERQLASRQRCATTCSLLLPRRS